MERKESKVSILCVSFLPKRLAMVFVKDVHYYIENAMHRT
jgi:hypothetical protein